MSKEELFKKYQEIILKTNGGADDYIVALCQISDLIKEFAEEKSQQICDLEAKLKALQNGIIDDETLNMLVKEHKLYKDIEAKLAESEEEHELLINQFEEETEKLRKQIKQESDARKRFVEEVKNLKQQLAEKEKEIESLKHVKVTIGTMETNQVDISSTTYIDQDKISFAVEQLKKVKKDIDCHMAIREGDLPYNIECLLLDFADKIDNQIKAIKEGK